ncbi:hypothetical protein FQN57_002628 [Myotisia sp. PD_48]|nr:hypothetical protein FQN57_002628 [Myotisia sp. PD_48]
MSEYAKNDCLNLHFDERTTISMEEKQKSICSHCEEFSAGVKRWLQSPKQWYRRVRKSKGGVKEEKKKNQLQVKGIELITYLQTKMKKVHGIRGTPPRIPIIKISTPSETEWELARNRQASYSEELQLPKAHNRMESDGSIYSERPAKELKSGSSASLPRSVSYAAGLDEDEILKYQAWLPYSTALSPANIPRTYIYPTRPSEPTLSANSAGQPGESAIVA